MNQPSIYSDTIGISLNINYLHWIVVGAEKFILLFRECIHVQMRVWEGFEVASCIVCTYYVEVNKLGCQVYNYKGSGVCRIQNHIESQATRLFPMLACFKGEHDSFHPMVLPKSSLWKKQGPEYVVGSGTYTSTMGT